MARSWKGLNKWLDFIPTNNFLVLEDCEASFVPRAAPLPSAVVWCRAQTSLVCSRLVVQRFSHSRLPIGMQAISPQGVSLVREPASAGPTSLWCLRKGDNFRQQPVFLLKLSSGFAGSQSYVYYRLVLARCAFIYNVLWDSVCRNLVYFQREERKVRSGISSLCLYSFTLQASPCKLWYHLSRIKSFQSGQAGRWLWKCGIVLMSHRHAVCEVELQTCSASAFLWSMCLGAPLSISFMPWDRILIWLLQYMWPWQCILPKTKIIYKQQKACSTE